MEEEVEGEEKGDKNEGKCESCLSLDPEGKGASFIKKRLKVR